jgi:hypothetical protein
MREAQSQAQATVFEIGDLLAYAKRELYDEDYGRVVAETGLRSTSNADNYIRVAAAKPLRKEEFRQHLPVGVGALIDLATWEEDQIRKCIDDGVMHHDATRQELKGWATKHRGDEGETPKAKPVLVVYAVGDWTEDDTLAIMDALARYPDNDEEHPRLKLDRPLTPEQKYDQQLARWWERVMDHIRKAARRSVRQAKKGRKGGKAVWAFYDEETRIPDDADEQHIRSVLETIGRPDVYDSLREDAMAAIEQPGPSAN